MSEKKEKAMTLSKLESAELPPKTLAPIEEAPSPPEEGKPPADLEFKSRRLMLKAGFGFAGNALESLTDDSDMNLDDDELNALIEAWEPFIPYMPPWIYAAIITGTIFGKKGLIFMRKRKKKKEEKPKAKAEAEPEAKTEAGKADLKGL